MEMKNVTGNSFTCFSIVGKTKHPIAFCSSHEDPGHARIFSSFEQAENVLEILKDNLEGSFEENKTGVECKEDLQVVKCFLIVEPQEMSEN